MNKTQLAIGIFIIWGNRMVIESVGCNLYMEDLWYFNDPLYSLYVNVSAFVCVFIDACVRLVGV